MVFTLRSQTPLIKNRLKVYQSVDWADGGRHLLLIVHSQVANSVQRLKLPEWRRID